MIRFFVIINLIPLKIFLSRFILRECPGTHRIWLKKNERKGRMYKARRSSCQRWNLGRVNTGIHTQDSLKQAFSDQPATDYICYLRIANKAHKANDASSWWQNYCMTTWLLTDQWTIRPSYRDAKMHLEGLVFLLWQYFCPRRNTLLFLMGSNLVKPCWGSRAVGCFDAVQNLEGTL